MKTKNKFIILLCCCFFLYLLPTNKQQTVNIPTPDIKETIIKYREYPEVVKLLQDWQQAAPQLVNVDKMTDKTAKGTDIYYVEITNRLNNKVKDKILIEAAKHGDEPLSSTVCQTYIATLLANYGKDKTCTDILDNYDLFLVPCTSPDSYGKTRYIENVDPNRCFNKPVPTIKALQNFFIKHHFCAALAGHTYGQLIIIPPGETRTKTPDEAIFNEVASEIARLMQYKLIHGYELYGNPIHGSEIDWYYKQGAFTFVVEYGHHQHHPTIEDTKTEFDRTWEGFKYFITNKKRKIAPQFFWPRLNLDYFNLIYAKIN